MRIDRVHAWEVLDSRGNPTVACEVQLRSGATGVASVPSGASTGRYEALELRDGGERFGGKGVLKAVENVNNAIGPRIAGFDPTRQEDLDAYLGSLDAGERFSNLGANAVLAVSVASALAAASERQLPVWAHLAAESEPLIPLPMVNIISGGAHAAGGVDFQDFLAIPVGAKSFSEAIEWAWRVRRGTAAHLEERGFAIALAADEGGLGPPMPSNIAAIEALTAGIARAGLSPGEQVAIGVDVASSQFFMDGSYELASEARTLDSPGMVSELQGWCEAFPIVSLEDPCAEDDWKGWVHATESLGTIQILGDDFFVTDVSRVQKAIDANVANSVLVKPNQAGTLSDAREVVELCRRSGYAAVVSARSGETEDSWLADVAVGWAAGQIKVGSTTRSERTSKWNRLLRIEQELGGRAGFAGRDALGGA